MKLIIGLGNPGKKYEKTRHNVGFLALDNYIKKYNSSYKVESNFNAVSCKLNNAIFIKPQTFMNLSGESVIKYINYYKIDVSDILVIYDDIAIPFNNIRIRETGSAGGHNGIKNIIQHTKTQDFKRVRIGVDNNTKVDMKDYVLGDFSKQEQIDLEDIFNDTNNLIDDFIKDERFDLIMNRYNRKG
ncbi:MAG: aminoacyl-tRNA hydrolase [bacterium]